MVQMAFPWSSVQDAVARERAQEGVSDVRRRLYIPEATPWVLDVLDKYGIKATFFMVVGMWSGIPNCWKR